MEEYDSHEKNVQHRREKEMNNSRFGKLVLLASSVSILGSVSLPLASMELVELHGRTSVCHAVVLAALDFDAQGGAGNCFEAGIPQSPRQSLELRPARRIPNKLLWVGELEDFEVVVEGVTDDETSVDETGDGGLDVVEGAGGVLSEETGSDAGVSGAEVGDMSGWADEGVEKNGSVCIHEGGTGEHILLPIPPDPHVLAVQTHRLQTPILLWRRLV